MLSEELPTYGYRRVWALRFARQTEPDGMPAINAKRVYRIMRQNALLLERKPAVPPSKRAHTGRVAVKEVISDGALTGLSSAVITEKNCGSRSRWTAVTVRHCTGRSQRVASTVKQYRTSCWERWNAASAARLPASPVEWLTDNGSCYRANETRQFAGCWDLNRRTRQCGVRK